MKRVLIVDDAAVMRLTIRTILEKNGFEVAGDADCGKDGIAKYKELRPDIVTMDITMPGISGIEAVKEIIDFDPDARIIMLSAMGQEQFIMEAVKAGAKSFLVKPFNEEHMIQTFTKVLSK
ncbi:two-component system chemotaxis response regulator CheY [Ruminiclostridium sufflavum DSM 19573]|uniref:Stage 0 sporulation protein A homolog n=1 Tax=Ruminiclostridium sufflavum DSM 19573 TaxID=1121337 RepID=A0A318XHF8_9FIRM|nr:response regulator [Ruminiclostridium sufflavum]PYG85859.1 two-component system chemotaxis response regulator CheY [Ruminiclostridium sufflavum DSM 19573]